ncbi:MAG: OmpA family protein [Thermodesulfobacteriota bacterium]
MARALVLALAALALAGCGVSKQVVAEKDAVLEVCRKDLAACQGERDAARSDANRVAADLEAARAQASRAEGELGACQAERKKGEGEAQGLRQELAACRREAEAARTEAAALKEQEESLRVRLQAELDAKTVEIENLRGRLSVRVVDRLLFASGSADIVPAGRAVLDKVAGGLAGGAERIRVEGHTDEIPIGPRIKDKWFSNWELSAARAASVVRYLQYGRGIEPARLEAVGLALYHPLGPNDTAAQRQRNRRVELVLTGPR